MGPPSTTPPHVDQQVNRGGRLDNENLVEFEPRGLPRNRLGFVGRYIRWLHTGWPAGTVEPLPEVCEDGSTNVPGVYVVGDLTGIPLLKFSADAGAKAVRRILADPRFQRERRSDGAEPLDLLIVGGGVSGMAAALEAQKAGLRFEIIEATEPFSTIVNFPKGKPIYTYPTEMTPAGDLQFRANVKEALVDELRAQTIERGIQPLVGRVESIHRRGGVLEAAITPPDEPIGNRQSAIGNLTARRVIIAIGRSGNFRTLNVPGEGLNKVYNRLHDPKDFRGQKCLVIGGGDTSLETAVALTECGAEVILSYRKSEFSRPKPENVERVRMLLHDPSADVQIEHPSSERVTTAVGDFLQGHRVPGSLRLMMSSRVKEIREESVIVADADETDRTLPNDVVFTMLGREPPLEFFRRSGIPIRGEWRIWTVVSLVLVLLAMIFIYHWKKTDVIIANSPYFMTVTDLGKTFAERGWFPHRVPDWWASLGGAFADPTTVAGTLKVSLAEPGFYYSFAYCMAVVLFGLARIRRRRTPYVTLQTVTLAAIQVIPLFLLPYLVLPWMGNNGWFNEGSLLAPIADSLFPQANYGHGREYWRAFGLILAWPLFIWNVFTAQPMWGWLLISFVQTFVLIPLMIWYWGKGAYCGWICSCGALAETMGDAHRHKMPHGPFWNRLNLLGQAFLAFAVLLLVFRSIGWAAGPESWASRSFDYLFHDIPFVNYVWFVDLLWAGILGVGLYWHFSGRVWCRFACPLAALMHVYARFSRFRILADKKRCISCNVCTSVCHQGIDVMNFANKGLPMADPECVRCSACVQSCPTGVLTFGQIERKTGRTIKQDPAWMAASPVLMREIGVNGRKVRV